VCWEWGDTPIRLKQDFQNLQIDRMDNQIQQPVKFGAIDFNTLYPRSQVLGPRSINGYIESWGRGIQKIINGFTDARMPMPEFEDSFGGFQLTMFKSVEKILALISMNPFITQSELAQSTGLTRRGVEKNTQQLKKSGKILRIGPDKGGHWQIVNSNE
jgi:predicted HTH transcriptional regulator